MASVRVHRPTKDAHTYAFECDVTGWAKPRMRFGFTTQGWRIPHSEMWDSVFPLWLLTWVGGPLFWQDRTNAQHVLKFDYPVSRVASEFFTDRTRTKYGYALEIDAPRMLDEIEPPSKQSRCVLAFGGGKDSRMLLGAMREVGLSPSVFYHSRTLPEGVSNVWLSRPIRGVQSERMMPAMMCNPKAYFLGTGLGEAHYLHPWQPFYEVSAWAPLHDFSRMLSKLGCEIAFYTPLTVLPYHFTQHILVERYPSLYAGQRSTPPQQPSAKNLHVSMCKLYHDVDPSDHCCPQLLNHLLQAWCDGRLSPPDGWYGLELELKALMYEMRNTVHLGSVKDRIPSSWEGGWIHYVHEYMHPHVDERLLEIFHQYAPSIATAPEGTFRFPQETT